MPDSEFTRLSRLVSLLTLLQSKRLLTATELAQRFSVSTRTIYRDMRTLEQAGVPLVTLEGRGYTLLEGYRLPPILFTREEAIALLTAEKLTRQRTDAVTAEHCQTAMDKLRSALKRSDRDHLETLTSLIEVLDSARPFSYPNTYEPLLTAISTHRVVHLHYQAAESGSTSIRSIEPIGLYLSQHWHVVAYCRLRQSFRDFRLDRIQQLTLGTETFSARPETLQDYWATEAKRRSKEKVVIRFRRTEVLPALAQHLLDTRHQYGWMHDQSQTDGSVDMTFLVGSLPYLATWLIPYASGVTILEPPALQQHLRELAKRVYEHWC